LPNLDSCTANYPDGIKTYVQQTTQLMNDSYETDENDDGASVPANIQMELFAPPKVARPEYNIGKNANSIFSSPYARDLYEEKHETRVIKHKDGTQTQGSLHIVPLANRKRPTTTTLRVYLGLGQLWENLNRPEDGVVEFSGRQLAHVMGKRWQGQHTSNLISEHLEILEYTKIEFAFTYKHKNGDYDEYTDPIKIISSGRYVAQHRRQSGDAFRQLHRYTLHPELVKNMLQNHVRPLNYQTFIALKNDISASLYTQIDLYLSGKPKYERRSFELLTIDLGYQGERYKSRRARHAKLKELVADLDGRELVHGKLSLTINPTKDNSDWKLTARKIPRIEPKRRPHIKPVNDIEHAEYLAEQVIADIMSQPRSGTPRLGYIIYLCRLYPENLIRDALAIAKADYRGSVRTTLVSVFVFELKRAAIAKGLLWPEKKPDKS
jgi:hypothetical protein